MWKEHLNRWSTKVFEEAIKLSIKAIIVAVWGSMLAAIALLAVYVGKAPPVLRHWIGGVLFGMAAPVALAFILNYVQLRRHEQARNAQHAVNRKGFLDFKVDILTGSQKLVRILNQISKQHEETAEQMARHTRSMDKLRVRGGNPINERAVASSAARDLNHCSMKFEFLADQYKNLDLLLTEGIEGLINSWPDKIEQQREFCTFATMMLNPLPKVIASQEAYMQSALGLLGISADLNSSISRHLEVIETLLTTMKASEARCIALRNAAQANISVMAPQEGDRRGGDA